MEITKGYRLPVTIFAWQKSRGMMPGVQALMVSKSDTLRLTDKQLLAQYRERVRAFNGIPASE